MINEKLFSVKKLGIKVSIIIHRNKRKYKELLLKINPLGCMITGNSYSY